MTENERNAALAADPIHAPRSIEAALVEARKRVTGTLLKEGRKTEGGGGNYNYVGHEHVVHHVRKAMLECGLSLIQTGLEMIGLLTVPGKHGDSTFLRWRATLELVHAESAAVRVMKLECLTQGNDKAGFIASTALDRTALLRLMGVAGSAEEDPEHNANNRDERPQTTQARVDTMQAKRDDRGGEAAARVKALAGHIAGLPHIRNREQLITWAALLLNEPMPDAEKKTGWTAYGERCAELEIAPADTRREFTIKARELRDGASHG
jgi:hypothetical protein